MSETKPVVFTVGHSLHPIDAFLSLLRQHKIDAVADVRTLPRSGRAPQYNRELLEKTLKGAGFSYVYLGDELGGRPRCSSYYDAKGHALYDPMSKDASFLSGVDRVLAGVAKGMRIALMCSEGDPCICHRHNLVAPVLFARGVGVFHIQKDGNLLAYDNSEMLIQSLGKSPKPIRK